MTPRAELHAMLEEYGIEYECIQGVTYWNCDDGRDYLAYAYESQGETHLAMKVVGITPAQAIAATIGNSESGTSTKPATARCVDCWKKRP